MTSEQAARGVADYSIIDVFRAVAGANPDRPCIVHRDQSLSYAEVLDRAEAFARVLAALELGIREERASLSPWESGQDHVALYLLNGPEYLEASLAGYAARAVPFNVNYRYVADELAYLLNDASTAAIVYHARFGPT